MVGNPSPRAGIKRPSGMSRRPRLNGHRVEDQAMPKTPKKKEPKEKKAKKGKKKRKESK
jgi:hypothetical protein